MLRHERLEERNPVWEPERYPGRRAIATWWRMSDQARHTGCATLGAMDAAISLEFDPQVTAFTSWPVRLGQARDEAGYVPDFFARLDDGRGLLVACRAGDPSTGTWPAELELLRAAAEQAGWQLRVHHQAADAVAAGNRQRLSRWRHARFEDTATACVLRQVFTRPRPLRDGVTASGLPELPTMARALHLVWSRELLIDWGSPFVPSRSLVWAPEEAR